MNAPSAPAPLRVPRTPREVLDLRQRLVRARLDEHRRRTARDHDFAADVAVVVIGLSLAVQVNVVGRLYVTELLLLALLPLVVVSRQRIQLPAAAKWLLGLTALWLLAQIVTDLYRATPAVDYLRGWARPVFFASNLFVLYQLLGGSHRRILLAAVALSAGRYFDFLFTPDAQQIMSPWKFGISLPLAMIAAVASTLMFRRGWVLPAALPLVALGLVNLALGARALSAVLFAVAAYVLFSRSTFLLSGVHLRRPSLRFAIGATLGVVLFMWAFAGAYGWAASSGRLGENARWLYEQQGQGSLGVLLGVRPNLYISFLAISDSPLLGHGSWARDPGAQYFLEARRFLSAAGYSVQVEYDGLIITHSHLLGSWVESGLLGTLVWLFAMGVAVRGAARAHFLQSPLLPLVGYLAPLVLWDVLFSPFGGDHRVMLPFALTVMLSLPAPPRHATMPSPLPTAPTTTSSSARAGRGVRP